MNVDHAVAVDVGVITPTSLLGPLAAYYDGPAEMYELPVTAGEIAALAAHHDRLFLVIGEPAVAGVTDAEAWLAMYAFRASHEWVDSLQLVVYGTAELPTAPEVGVDARLGGDESDAGSIDLTGYHLPPGPWLPGDVLPVTLFWRVDAPVAQDYQVFVHLIDASGQIVAQNDSAPVAGLRPTSGWEAGEVVVDPHGVWLGNSSGELLPGEYRLYVGMYLPATGDRLAVADGPTASGGDSLFLTSVEVVTPRDAP